MGRFFNMDNKFFVFMGKIADLCMLNLLCIICCIPIVTAGASLTALYYVTMKMVRNEEAYIFRSFFRSFKQNFKQATVISPVVNTKDEAIDELNGIKDKEVEDVFIASF